MPVDTPPLPGDSVGPYRLKEVLGVGGMATVYLAMDPQDRRVAVKILHPGKAGTDDARRFRREFLTLRDLRHENVVQVYEAGVQGDYPWIAMELIEGTDLGSLVDRWTEDPPADRFARVEHMLRGVCAALAHVHEAGLIHRDIKPSNVLVTRAGDARLTDFGVVKAPGHFNTQLTVAGRLVGTIAFMAPEQITGDAVDSRADLYSLGAVLYVMLTGEKPIQADTIAGYLARHLTQAPLPPSELDPRVPARLEQVCLTLLRKDPSQRYASARQVLEALDTPAGDRRLPVHGREEELIHLLARVERLAEGEGGVVVLSAPEGRGKSALLAELVARARGAGRDVAAADGGGVQPLRALRSQLPVRGPAEEDLSDPGEDIADLSAGRPWTLVVDHLDRLSPLELDTLTRLVRTQVAIHGEPLLLVGAIEDPRGRVAGLVSGADTGLSTERIDLGTLDARAVVAMVRDRGLGGAAGAALGRRLAEESEGHPGAVVEQLDALLRARWLVRDEGGELRSTRDLDALREEALPVPERIRQREADRLARLAAPARALVEALAILGEEAPLPVAATMAELTAAEGSRAAQALVQAGMVSRQSTGLEDQLGLSSERLREVVVDALPASRRMALHRAAAQILSGGRRRTEADNERLTAHLLAAGESAQAFPLLMASARRRLAAGQPQVAARLLRRAAEIRPGADATMSRADSARAIHGLLALQGEAAWRTGDLTGAQQAWETAVAQADDAPDPATRARAAAGVGLVFAARGEDDAAIPRLQAALTHLPPGDPMWAPVVEALAEGQLAQGEAAQATTTWQRLLSVGEESGSERLAARARAGLAQSQLGTVSLSVGRAALTRAATRLRIQEQDPALARLLLRLSELLLADGQLYDARERALEADRIGRSAGRGVERTQGLGLAACALAALGTDAEARQVAREAAVLARTRDASHDPAALVALLPVVRALLDLGLCDEATGLLPDQAPSPSPGQDAPAAQLLALRARLLSWQEPESAERLALDALSLHPPLLVHASCRLALDAVRALVRVRSPQAPAALAELRRRLPAEGARLMALEAALQAARIHLPEPAGTAARLLASSLDEELGAQGRMARRWAE